LRILEQEGVTATFLTCGAIAERYAEAVNATVQKGHEIAGHGYHHGGTGRRIGLKIQGSSSPRASAATQKVAALSR
jgi:hypothetical protein